MKFNILDFLLPRETKFYTFFIEQAQILVDATHIFRDLTYNYKNLDEDGIKHEISRIRECEKKSDVIEGKIITELHDTFITPFDREDIHTIAITIDRALDILTSISNKMEMYGIREVPVSVCNFSLLIVESAETLLRLMSGLEKRKDLDLTIKTLHELENKADYLFYLSVGELVKKGTNPLEVMMFKDVYEYLESVVDAIDYVGKIIRRVMIKQG